MSRNTFITPQWCATDAWVYAADKHRLWDTKPDGFDEWPEENRLRYLPPTLWNRPVRVTAYPPPHIQGLCDRDFDGRQMDGPVLHIRMDEFDPCMDVEAMQMRLRALVDEELAKEQQR